MVSFDVGALVGKLQASGAKMKPSNEVSLAVSGVVGTITAIQLFTDWNPVGRCFVFWKQLRHHVSFFKKKERKKKKTQHSD